MSKLGLAPVITATKAPKHYGTSCNSTWQASRDRGYPKVRDMWEEEDKCEIMSWFIYMVSPNCYRPLLPDSIRLLRLLPNEDEKAPIQCQLFHYSLQKSGKRTHPYDALSYVWGGPAKPRFISISEHNSTSRHDFPVTENLHEALSHAVCIDQENDREKEQQIQFMAKIYGQANCVVAWLGKAADDSDQALEEIRVAGVKKWTFSSNYKTVQQAVLALLQRPWFRRIWVLQEVAAARHVLIMCGPTEIDGYAFCSGLGFYKARQSVVPPVISLIRGAIFRPDYSMGRSGRSSLDICPLSELIDMYHAHEAARRHDKVYALLGMSSDDLSKVNLSPDYNVRWEELLQRLVKYLLCEEIFVETWGDREIAIIKSKGCILGKVSSVRSNNIAWSDTHSDDRVTVDIIFKNTPGQPGYMEEGSAHWTLPASAKSIRDGDIICLLQGASRPSVIRLCKDHFTIIMIAADLENVYTGSRYIKWLKLLQSETVFTRDFILVWGWESSLENEALIQTNIWESERSKIEFHLEKATRTWNVSLILGDLEEYQKAEEGLREAIEGYKIAFGEERPHTLQSQYGLTPLSWASGNGYDTVVKLLLGKDGVDPDYPAAPATPPPHRRSQPSNVTNSS
ncbi:Heterokaryon incompatibility protein (HET) domain containing protein [Elaphomyces granulatus]